MHPCSSCATSFSTRWARISTGRIWVGLSRTSLRLCRLSDTLPTFTSTRSCLAPFRRPPGRAIAPPLGPFRSSVVKFPFPPLQHQRACHLVIVLHLTCLALRPASRGLTDVAVGALAVIVSVALANATPGAISCGVAGSATSGTWEGRSSASMPTPRGTSYPLPCCCLGEVRSVIPHMDGRSWPLDIQCRSNFFGC